LIDLINKRKSMTGKSRYPIRLYRALFIYDGIILFIVF